MTRNTARRYRVPVFIGGTFEISPTMGKGFKLDEAPPANYPEVIMFTAGTGIAPLKAIIESEALQVGFLLA